MPPSLRSIFLVDTATEPNESNVFIALPDKVVRLLTDFFVVTFLLLRFLCTWRGPKELGSCLQEYIFYK